MKTVCIYKDGNLVPKALVEKPKLAIWMNEKEKKAFTILLSEYERDQQRIREGTIKCSQEFKDVIQNNIGHFASNGFTLNTDFVIHDKVAYPVEEKKQDDVLNLICDLKSDEITKLQSDLTEAREKIAIMTAALAAVQMNFMSEILKDQMNEDYHLFELALESTNNKKG
jgi:hypothetical protein